MRIVDLIHVLVDLKTKAFGLSYQNSKQQEFKN